MRVRISTLNLVDTGRRVVFEPGLNVITGPITTGKTTLLRLSRVLLGSVPEPNKFPREVRDHVRAVAGDLMLADSVYAVVRPFVSTVTAKVDIAGPTSAWRLPAVQPDATAPTTYIRWLLQVLGLPDLRVRTAPTLPESETAPLTINDYMMYCYLSQADIDKSVFGSDDHFRDVKRRYVFQVLYGSYNAEAAELEEQLRQVLSDLRQLQSQTRAFERFLEGTVLENRAVVTRELEQTRSALAAEEAAAIAVVERNGNAPMVDGLRSGVKSLDSERAELQESLRREQTSIDQLGRLVNQLEAQSARLTRSIVAEGYIVDFEFIVCPRCGTGLGADRGGADLCSLCLQKPEGTRPDREMLIAEQERLGAQIIETRELIETHRATIRRIEQELVSKDHARAEVAHELDFQLRTFISDAASDIAGRAAQRAGLESTVRRLEDYTTLYAKLDRALGDAVLLDGRRVEIESALERARSRQDDVEARIVRLESEFDTILQRFGIPRFASPPSATIDRRTFLPIVDGRRWSELSSAGLQVLVNVAHALAHQRTALALGLPLPQILLIDGLTSNVGHEGLDAERINSVYDYLLELSKELGDQLQIIVADNDIPPQARPFVRLELTEDDRLIPLS